MSNCETSSKPRIMLSSTPNSHSRSHALRPREPGRTPGAPRRPTQRATPTPSGSCYRGGLLLPCMPGSSPLEREARILPFRPLSLLSEGVRSQTRQDGAGAPQAHVPQSHWHAVGVPPHGHTDCLSVPAGQGGRSGHGTGWRPAPDCTCPDGSAIADVSSPDLRARSQPLQRPCRCRSPRP